MYVADARSAANSKEVVLHVLAVYTETTALRSGQEIGSLLEQHELAEEGSVSTMRITQTYDSKEAGDGAIAPGMDQRTEACYQPLDTALAGWGSVLMNWWARVRFHRDRSSRGRDRRRAASGEVHAPVAWQSVWRRKR